MVPRGFKGRRDAFKNTFPRMIYHRGLAMHKFTGRDHFASEHFTYALMPQAHAEYGDLAAEFPYNLVRYACLRRPPWAGRNHNVAWLHFLYLIQSYLIVPEYDEFLP